MKCPGKFVKPATDDIANIDRDVVCHVPARPQCKWRYKAYTVNSGLLCGPNQIQLPVVSYGICGVVC